MGKKKGKKQGGNADDEWKDDGVVSSMLDNTDVTGDNPKPPLPDAGKKGKTKKKKIADNWEDELEDKDDEQVDTMETEKPAAAAAAAGGKKGKKIVLDSWEGELEDEGLKDNLLEAEKPLSVPGGKKGKKSKKGFADIDWEDELKDDVDKQEEDTKGDAMEPEKSLSAPAGKKGKKSKKGFADIDWEDKLKDDSDIQEDTKGDTMEPEKPPAGKKGKKSKKGFADFDWEDELKDDTDKQDDTKGDTIEPEKPPASKKGKKSKKGFADLEWEDELTDESIIVASQVDKQEETKDTATVAGGKKGKKKKKQQQQDELEDDISAELEQLRLDPNAPAPVQDKPAKPVDTKPSDDKEVAQTEEEVKQGDGGMATATDDGEKQEASTLRTAAQKRAEKKEREKEKKKKEAAKAKEKLKAQQQGVTETQDETVEEADVTVTEPSKDAATADTTEDTVVNKDDDDDVEDDANAKDDKKKKKKKKKTAKEEADKSAAATKTKKPAASAIKRMKENLELLRLEQKKREEEELAKQKAEEEAEQKRLEKVRLEQERKEKKRQKEKERRERLKKEGKLLTKAEKEKKMKMEAQLEVLLKQGAITVPARHTQDGDGVKKPVKYGTRFRGKQKKDTSSHTNEEEMPVVETATGTTQQLNNKRETNSIPEGATGGGVPEDDDAVPDNWDAADSEEEKDSVKDNWDDEEEEEDDKDSDEPMDEVVDEPVIKSDANAASAAAPALEEEADLSEEDDEDSEEEEEESISSSSSSEEEEDSDLTPAELARQKVIRRIAKRRADRDAARSEEAIRSPVVCVLGHVDTGKTKILDKIRHSNVQDGEAGGITQQIGATFVPDSAIREQTKFLKEFSKTEIRLPGLLIIDTPGHESFSNLRNRGSSMCDLAILVVDLMHGLEPQTIESLNLLLKKKVPFVVALNKIDRLFDWRRYPNFGVRECIKKQKQNTKDEFEERTKHVITELAEQGVNAALFWEKVNFKEYIPLVPTSAISGDGMGDLIALLVTYSQRVLISSLLFSEELECILLEVKAIAGLGTTVDVILRNGILREGDTIVLSGSEGPLVTQIRALLMPQPLKELRVKNAYVTHKLVPAAQGVKVTAKDLEKSLAGFPVFVAEKPDEVDILKEEAAKQMKDVLSAIQTQERGVYVQASTLGSLEALLGFLKDSKIPYSGVSIGPVHKKDVMKCSVQLDRDSQWAVILAFDVRVEREAQEMADNVGVRIFTADIIYHLFDNFMKHRQELKDRKREEYKHIAVFPCKLRILPDCVFNARDPIVVGVTVEGGMVKTGTPIVVPSKGGIELGVITSVEANHKSVEVAYKGQEVAVKIESVSGDAPKLYGRHFDHTDLLVSKISRESIDAVKNYFREDLQKTDWHLMIELKKLLGVY